eukprot:gene28271-35107_t
MRKLIRTHPGNEEQNARTVASDLLAELQLLDAVLSLTASSDIRQPSNCIREFASVVENWATGALGNSETALATLPSSGHLSGETHSIAISERLNVVILRQRAREFPSIVTQRLEEMAALVDANTRSAGSQSLSQRMMESFGTIFQRVLRRDYHAAAAEELSSPAIKCRTGRQKRYIAVSWQQVVMAVTRDLVPHFAKDPRNSAFDAQTLIDNTTTSSLLWDTIMIHFTGGFLSKKSAQNAAMNFSIDVHEMLSDKFVSTVSTVPNVLASTNALTRAQELSDIEATLTGCEAKKFEKLIEQGIKKRDDFMPWRDYPSNELFNHKFGARIDEILYLTRKSVDMYSEKFRKTYPSLAIGELEFVKNKDRETVRTRFWIGLKLGLIICGVIWLISDSYAIPNSLRFWTRPGLYMYTTVGNLLLFRFLWALSIFVWSRHEVNYIAVFQLHDDRPNILLVINQTVTQFVLYTANLILFFRANCHPSGLNDTFIAFGCPALLILMCGCYELYEYLNFREERVSRGVFTKHVVYDCVMAPFAKVTFRDNYAADTLTSFTKVISDFVYASCWIISGAFLKPDQTNSNFGSDYLMCNTDNVKLFIIVLQLYPQWVRIMQCARNYYLTRLPVHLRNITKYLTTVLVILFGMFYTTFNTLYICVIVFSTLYKWWWDVVMDWGLFECLPVINGTVPNVTLADCLRSDRRGGVAAQPTTNSNTNSNTIISDLSPLEAQTINDTPNAVTPPSIAQSLQTIFLRQNLLYPSYMVYYVCIVLDLLLRFLWIVSLLPPNFFGTLIGPKMSFCLASLEIARRAMWGIFRLEFEHLKFVKKGTVGFHEPKYIRHRANSLAQVIGPRDTSGKEQNLHSAKDLSHLHSVDGTKYANMHTKEYDDVDDADTVGFSGKLNRARAGSTTDTIKLSHAQSVVNFFSSHGSKKNSPRKPPPPLDPHNTSSHSQYSNPPHSERHMTHH